MNNNGELLIRRVFRKSSAILTVNFIILFVSSLIDGLIISLMLGFDAMASFQLSVPLTMFVLMVSQIFIAGNKNLCAAKMGTGKLDEAKSLFSSTIIALFLLGVTCSAFILMFSSEIAGFLGAEGDFKIFRKGTVDYITGYAPGVVFLFLAPAFSDRLYLSGKQKIIILPLVIQTLTDIIGNILSVTVFNAGMFGVGFATSLSYLFSFLSLKAIDFFTDVPFKFSVKAFSFSRAITLFFNGLPESSKYCWIALQNYIINRLLVSIGQSFDMAVLSYIGLLGIIMNPFTLATSTSAFTLAGIFAEDHDRHSLRLLTSIAVNYRHLEKWQLPNSSRTALNL